MRGLALTVMPGASGAARIFFLAITYPYLAFFLAAAFLAAAAAASAAVCTPHSPVDIIFLLSY
jgi:hypothetical protein